jgi:hypothetical protein
MSKPIVYIVGADKGGVGKTHTTRALVDYLDSRAVPNRAFDTENEVLPSGENPTGGVLKRFFPERAEIVDLSDSDGQMRVFDTLGSNVTVIDIKAGVLSPTLIMLRDIGFLDPARYEITVAHVLSNNQASIDEVDQVRGLLGPMRHVLIGNRNSSTKFAFPPAAIEIPMLSVAAAEAVDKSSLPFSVFAKTAESAVMRGTVDHWLKRVFAQFAGAQL